MPLEFLTFWLRETFSNLARNRLMSLLAMSTVTIGLIILGGFYLTWTQVRAMVDTQTRKLDISVILEPNISAQRRHEIFEACRISQVADVKFVSKDQALREMHRDTPGIPIDDLLKDNPLGDELRISVKDPQTIPAVRAYLNTLRGKGVVETLSEIDFVNKLLQINRMLTIFGSLALLVLGLGILAIIYNTIRLTIHARRREIRIMELVGATRGFIRVPFVLEGIVLGLAGSLIAAALLASLYSAAGNMVPPTLQLLIPLAKVDVMRRCALGMILSGLVFGFVGSSLSLERSISKVAQQN